jgi:hypothetical protein
MEGIYDGLPGGDDVSCGGKPFTAATLVLLSNGKAVRPRRCCPAPPISEPTENGHQAWLFSGRCPVACRMAVSSGAVLRSSYLKQWRPASKLKKGERLKTANGTTAVADGGITPKVRDDWMWDLTVPGNNDHDFYVAAGDSAVLVHNCGPQEFPNLEPENMPLDEGDAISSALLLLLRGQGRLTGRSLPHRAG